MGLKIKLAPGQEIEVNGARFNVARRSELHFTTPATITVFNVDGSVRKTFSEGDATHA